METHSMTAPVSKGAVIGGWIMGGLPALLLMFSAAMKIMQPPAVVEGTAAMGLDPAVLLPLGIVELACAVLYLIPQTAVIGAILCTGYMGGAIYVHMSKGEPFIMQTVIGVVFWGGLYLRDRRIRALIPIRRKAA